MRSASRDVVDRFAGNRGYFHRADGFRRWKHGAAFCALGLVLGWLVVEFLRPSQAASRHSHGELAHPHAAFDSNCQACHQPHSPGDFFTNPLSVFKTHERWHDLTCIKCHAGPAHHASARDGGAFHEQCSNCHHDHQGREHSLTRLTDEHCSKCHADLPAAHSEGNTRFAKSITGFTRDHPEFKPLERGKAEAERRLKFSHALHLAPGLVYDPADKHPWTAEKLGLQFGAAAKKQYASPDASATAPIQLTCAACHQLDAGHAPPGDVDRPLFDQRRAAIGSEPRAALLPSRSEGAYFLPVNFELHCQACHPIRTPSAVSGGRVIEPFGVPHRKQPDALRGTLRGEFAARLANEKHPVLAAPLGPGGRLDPPTSPEIAAFGKEVERLTDFSLKSLTLNLEPATGFGERPPPVVGGFACGKCHYATESGKAVVAPLPQRTVWFEHAKFNHASHRGVACSDCHPGTSGRITEREPALIAGIKTCQACHAAVGTVVDWPDGRQAIAAGVRHSCTDCHRYHNGDRPLEGLGSPRRDPAQPLPLKDWLEGK